MTSVNFNAISNKRVLSGMRPTGRLHLGQYHGVLKNWLKLQHEYECLFFVADWHALTTHYSDSNVIVDNIYEMVVDWLAVGINPAATRIFVQSRVPEHAELHLLLSMITPLTWLERVPTYKDQQERLKERDLGTYGFLGYPLLQAADILIYKSSYVPVGEDQVAHVELTREVARRFNHIFGKEESFEEKAEAAIRRLGKKNGTLYRDMRRRYQEQGEREALEMARALLENANSLTLVDRDRLFGYLEGNGRSILLEPEALLTEAAKVPGLDGQKMSKSYHNTINLREDASVVEKKLRSMPTDPARMRRHDPGDPARCPVWQWHQIYTSPETHAWIEEGCKSAAIGCTDCKQPLIEAVLAELAPIREHAAEYASDLPAVRDIIEEGCSAAREVARATLQEVREVMGLVYR